MEFELKRAHEGHAREYTRLQADTWQETYKGIVAEDYLATLHPADGVEGFLKLLQSGESEIYIARAGGCPAGRLVLGKPRAPGAPGELQAFYLLQAFHGQGFGRRMMDFVLNRLWGLGSGSAALWVLEQNEGARQFYEHFGFLPTGLWEEETIGGQGYHKLRYSLARPAMGGTLFVREAQPDDLPGLLCLYAGLHSEPPPDEAAALAVWVRILKDDNHHVLLAEQAGVLVASCVVVVVPNLTRGARPYALVENVVTATAHRRKGHGLAVMQKAVEIAQTEDCYKVMLSTSRQTEKIFAFYEAAGFNRKDKTAFVRWLT